MAASASMPPAFTGPLPEAAPPPDMGLYQLPTGTYETRAAFAFKGGSFRDRRRFAATAVLVRHPGGDLLIDAGFGADVAAHVRAQPRIARAPYRAGSTASAQLEAAGYDRDRLGGVLLTHAHWDHVGGLDRLRVPVWINRRELRSATESRDGSVFRAVSKDREIREYEFDGRPYLGFPSSYDVHGDGSVVVALAGGHTEGSVVVFVTLPDGKRYAFIGDLAWQLEGVTRLAERPLLMRRLADADGHRVREGLRRLARLADLMRIVPAHDLAAYDGIPLLDPSAGGAD